MKLLIEASQIPIGATVSKRTGDKEYLLKDEIIVYGIQPNKISADPGVRFMVSSTGAINAISGETQLLWHTNERDLQAWLHLLELNSAK